MGCIYRVLCKSNGKSYIGQYRLDDPKCRWNRHVRDAEKGSNCAIHQAMRKYGIDSFEVSTLCICKTQQELDKKEDEFITEYNSMISDNGYNMVPGGKGRAPDFHHSEKHKVKMSEFMKNRIISDETREKISKARQGTKMNLSHEIRKAMSERSKKNATGKQCLEETKRKISESLKGRPGVCKGQKRSEEQKKRMSDAKLGNILTEEHREKLSAAQMERHSKIQIPNKNCKYSVEDIRYMRKNPDNLSIDELRKRFTIERYRLLKIQRKEVYKHVLDE